MSILFTTDFEYAGVAARWLQCYKNSVSVKDIKELRAMAPFKQFSLHLTSGRTLNVTTADHLGIAPRGDLLVLSPPDGGVRVIDPAQVASVEVQTAR